MSSTAVTVSPDHGPATSIVSSEPPDRRPIAAASSGAAVPAVAGSAAMGSTTR